jgi:hypothetical protein
LGNPIKIELVSSLKDFSLMLSALKANLKELLLKGMCVSILGCSVFPSDDKPAKAVSPPKAEPSSPTIHLDMPTPISSARLLRRISIDVMSRLPTKNEEQEITSGNSTLNDLVTGYLDNAEFNRSMAERHLRMWKLADGKTPDLERFAAKDAAFLAKLTAKTRDVILREPTYILRKILEERLPFSEIFTVPWTILHNDALAAFSKSGAKQAWPGEPESFYAYQDGRPNFGIFQTWGLHASIDTSESDQAVSHTSHLMNRFTCKEEPASFSHLFYALTTEDFAAVVGGYALSQQACAGCHRRIENIAPDLAGLFLGTTLTNWLQYSDVSDGGGSLYSGQAYNNVQELSSLIAKDPRMSRCEVKSLFESLLQRPAISNDADRNQLSYLSVLFASSGESIRAVVKNLVLSPTYATDIQDQSTKPEVLGKHSGVKFLLPSAWGGILSQLNANAGLIDIPHALDAGLEEGGATENSVPSNTYYHAMRTVAIAAAQAIILQELADGRTRESRAVLTELPDGSGQTASADVIDAQIISIWDRLTAYHLLATDKTIVNLKSLYTNVFAAETTADAGARKAWTYVLAAILMSPEFITY